MRLGGKPHYRTTRPTLSFIDTRVMLEVMPGSRGVGGVVGGEGRGGEGPALSGCRSGRVKLVAVWPGECREGWEQPR